MHHIDYLAAHVENRHSEGVHRNSLFEGGRNLQAHHHTTVWQEGRFVDHNFVGHSFVGYILEIDHIVARTESGLEQVSRNSVGVDCRDQTCLPYEYSDVID